VHLSACTSSAPLCLHLSACTPLLRLIFFSPLASLLHLSSCTPLPLHTCALDLTPLSKTDG
jgi:hypothetical protein